MLCVGKLQKSRPRADHEGALGWKCCNLADDFLRNKKSPHPATGLFLFSGKNEKGK
jgi:hypothetical protein